MANKHVSRSAYFMRDQVRGKVRTLMDETWFNSPVAALCTLLVLAAAVSIVGAVGVMEPASAAASVVGGAR